MMTQLSRITRLEWPTAVVLLGVLGLMGFVWWSAPDHRGDFLLAIGTLGATVLAYMRGATPPPPPSSGAPRSSDSDGPPTRPRRVTMQPPAARSWIDVLFWSSPPARRMSRPTYTLARVGGRLVLLFAFALVGCGASALRVHAIAADTSGALLDATCQEVRTTRGAEQLAVPHTTLEETQALVDDVRARWAPAVAACNVVAEAHGAWVDAIVHAVTVGELDLTIALPLALRVVTAWADLVPLASAVGLALPPPPAELVRLTGGAR